MHCTIFSDNDEEKLAIVVRLNLYRSLRSMIVTNSMITLEVVFASEFCDAALSQMAIRSYDLMASFIRTPTKDGHVDASLLGATNIADNHDVVLCKLVSVNDKTAVYKVRFPSELGHYQLLLFSRPKVCDENVSSNSSSDSNNRASPTITAQSDLFQDKQQDDIIPKLDTRIDGICILPLLTDVFELVATTVGMNLTTTPLLSCYRLCAGLVIKEEYGHTIGSHVYDSSIVMLRYLNKMLLQSPLSSSSSSSSLSLSSISSSPIYTSILSCSPNDIVMELGSGCGLVSMWLSQHIPMRIVATDLAAQLPFLRSNVHRNTLPSLPPQDIGSIKNDDETTSSSSQTQIPLTTQSRLPLVARLNWTEFRTKINQHDDSPLQNEMRTIDASTPKMGMTFIDQEQSQTRPTHVYQQDGLPVYPDGSDRPYCEHTTATDTTSPLWTFRQTYQFEHMGLTATDECAMIIACDVLYDRTIVDDFFAVVRSFSKRSPSRTVLLLAQKLRNYDDHVFTSATSSTSLPPTVDVTQIKGFVCHKVWEEAQVVIWEMWIDPE